MPLARTFETPWGPVAVAATARGIAGVVLPGFAAPLAGRWPLAAHAKAGGERADRHARRAERELRQYLSGRRRRFTVPLDLGGLPPFQRRVLAAARRIPYGKTATYGRLAARAGKPKAARAVGQAMARNPVPILVPCHRVVAANGLGGFGGGLVLKRRLLALENTISTQRPRRAQMEKRVTTAK